MKNLHTIFFFVDCTSNAQFGWIENTKNFRCNFSSDPYRTSAGIFLRSIVLLLFCPHWDSLNTFIWHTEKIWIYFFYEIFFSFNVNRSSWDSLCDSCRKQSIVKTIFICLSQWDLVSTRQMEKMIKIKKIIPNRWNGSKWHFASRTELLTTHNSSLFTYEQIFFSSPLLSYAHLFNFTFFFSLRPNYNKFTNSFLFDWKLKLTIGIVNFLWVYVVC